MAWNVELAVPHLQFSSSTSLAKEGKFVGNDKFAGVKELNRNSCLPVFYNNQDKVDVENQGERALRRRLNHDREAANFRAHRFHD
jgi:hypothetical protein